MDNDHDREAFEAAATKWHDEQAEDGIVTEARKLRAALSQDIMQVGSER